MQTGALISFKVSGKNNHTNVNRFCREFYGYKDKSNKGKYVYERKGFLSEYPHIKVQRGLIIINMDDAGDVIDLLEKYNAEIFMREIILLHADKEKLKASLNEKYTKKRILNELE
ncbi:MAG: hypothetical protein KAI18_02150 [Candidatus Aenigmarchaeota archaeon]|nr:hypothetical protein [Candidatus Aenigmarchaeota archaeon]